ncbi:cilia- and flagella-associated protein 70 isoform X2 [Rhinatrema bivittatum]|nr:cilia- and flagella-associated protein 70 isoform X2 [Rhinatrema bivittatum]XP_029431999.1 cilia- and flagella-associated protein 70 isoform X2 [Rhinatrema bivittatum]
MEATHSESKPIAPVKVSVTVLKGYDLKSVRGESIMTYARAEYNNVLLGDSPKYMATPNKTVEYNFTTSFDYSIDGSNTLDDIAYKPFIVTVFEILPKEKKQKEEKTAILGQALIDLLPLLQGECKFKKTIPLHPMTGYQQETVRPDVKSSLEVSVSVPESLLSEFQLSNGNLLKVTIETVYSVPESWGLVGPQYNYVVALQVPMTGEKEYPILFTNGVLKVGGEKEPFPRQKKWASGKFLVPGAQYIPEAFIVGGPYEEEHGELNHEEDKKMRIEAETMKKRVAWDIERRCYLDPFAVICLQKRIGECRYWPVEIMRQALVPGVKAKPGKGDKGDDENPVSFHGVAYVNMVSLLYPGVKSLRGAFRLLPYHDSEVFEKTKYQMSLLRELMRQAKQGLNLLGVGSPQSKHLPSKVTKDEKGSKEREPLRRTSIMPLRTSEHMPESEQFVTYPNLEGQQYAESESYIVLELVLEKPLVPKRMPEELAKKLKEFIPPRPHLPRQTSGAEKAVADYHSQIVSITNAVLDEYYELFGQQVSGYKEVDGHTLEEQKCQLNFELNCSGKYFAFKEQLKHAVVKIVREKYLRTTAFEDSEQLQAFLEELYIYLVDQMHIALNQTISDDSAGLIPPPTTDSQQLRHFAREAEINDDFELAAAYHQERLAQDRQSVEHWLDYGISCLLTGNIMKAQECFHESITLNQEHLHSLLMCGIVAVLMERYYEAEIFFENATCMEPTSILAWTLLGLFYEIQGNDIQMDMAFLEAGKHHPSRIAKEMYEVLVTDMESHKEDVDDEAEAVEKGGPDMSDGILDSSSKIQLDSAEPSMNSHQMEEGTILTVTKSLSHISKSTPRLTKVITSGEGTGTEGAFDSTRIITPAPSLQPSKHTTIFMETAQFLIKVNAVQFVQRALAHELVTPDGGLSCEYHIISAQMHLLKKEFSEAEKSLLEAIQIDYQNPDAWALTGHLHYLNDHKAEAKACYERTVSFVTDASEMHPVYLRLGSLYLEDKEYEKSKYTYLLACKNSPSCLSWLGVGIACYRLEELTEAEDALTEANTLNNKNAEVWGYLALVCLKTGRQLEAEQSYKYLIKLKLQNEDLLQEIHIMQQQVGFGNPSF